MRPQPGAQGERPLSEVNFLTVAEAASILRISKMAVYRLVHDGALPAIRVGRTFRVPERAVREMATLHEQSDTA
ncbi:helix-turn-helix domain-containing protein [Streptomyces nigra]|uniref:helix-turn-helix domain-containing protein n=1 Tax=Streptomyces nigra TaxID=1827580 RepID=UPI00363F3C95